MGEADLLRLVQWLSPAFPLGAFAWSHGLETAIASGGVRDASALTGWVSDVLADGSGLCDAVLLVAAWQGNVDAADRARALAPSRERWSETLEQGTAFAREVGALGVEVPHGVALPVAVGHAARHLDLPIERVATLYLQAFAANLVAAAVRFMPLGQSAGQRVNLALHPLILVTAARAVTLTPDDITTAVFGADLSAMRHETEEVRIFRS